MSWEATSAVVQMSKQKGSLSTDVASSESCERQRLQLDGVRRLAAETRLSQRNVRYLIRKSEALGELEVFIGQGEKGTNLYRVTCVPDNSGRAGKSCLPAKFAPCRAGAHSQQPSVSTPLQ
jgi:hypothetical protein